MRFTEASAFWRNTTYKAFEKNLVTSVDTIRVKQKLARSLIIIITVTVWLTLLKDMDKGVRRCSDSSQHRSNRDLCEVSPTQCLTSLMQLL